MGRSTNTARISSLIAFGLLYTSEGRSHSSEGQPAPDLVVAQSADGERQDGHKSPIASGAALAFVPLRDERIAILDGKSLRIDAATASPIYAGGAHVVLSIVCIQNTPAPKMRIDRLFLESAKVDLTAQSSQSDISNIKALGDTAVDRLQITLNGAEVTNAFWKDALGKPAFVRAEAFNRDLLDRGKGPKVIDLSCKDNEVWTAKVDIAQRAEGVYRLRFVATSLAGTLTNTIYSDPILVEQTASVPQ